MFFVPEEHFLFRSSFFETGMFEWSCAGSSGPLDSHDAALVGTKSRTPLSLVPARSGTFLPYRLFL